MEPGFPTTQSPVRTPSTDTYTNYTPPADPSTSPASPEAGTRASHGAGHHWMHLLMCAPMLLVVGFLLLTGRAGGGSIVYALGCLAMMGVMMALMGRGSGGGSGTPSQGHHR